MLAHKLTLPDGTVLDSGAIRSVTLTEQVGDQTDLCPGAACAACAEIELWAPGNALAIAQGTEITLARVDTASGAETQEGIFLAEKPERVSANVIKVTAYDRMTLFDKDLSPWLREQQGAFPMSLTAFIRAVCAQCGVVLAGGTLDALPNAGYQIAAFYADDLTGRQLIQWAAQAACRFARMTPDGHLEFGWYSESALQGVGPGAETVPMALNLSGQIFTCAGGEVWTFGQPRAAYVTGGLRYEDYLVPVIDKVQIRQSDDDVGVIYPPDETGTNTLVLQGNLLLTTATAETLRPVVQAIYTGMQGLTYTPAEAELLLLAEPPAPGQILIVTDAHGHAMRMPVMQRRIAGQAAALSATGNAGRDSTTAVNEQKYQNLQGKLLEVKADVDGLKVTASDLAGDMTRLEQTVDGITLTAENDGDSSRLSISANGIELSSTDITFEGMVTFADLSGSGTSVINGDNIVTGVIEAESGNTEYNLVNGYIRSGPSAGTRFEINANRVNWYVDNYLTGVLYSVYGTSYLGANSRYTRYGWVNSATPSSYLGMQVDQVSSQAAFNTLHVDLTNTNGQLGVSGSISARDLSVWGSKNRVVRTPLGNLAFAAMESPEPAFCDWGGGTIGEDGVCPVCFSQQYAAGICLRQAVRWLVTPVDGPGSFWVERTDWGALVHGQPGSRFDWMCIGVQADMGALYAPESAATTPVESDPAVERALADILDGEREAMEILMEVQQ